jgi:hypothetical protein
MYTTFGLVKVKKRENLEDPRIDGYIFKEQTWVKRRGLDSSGAENTEVADPEEHRNQTSGSTHCWMFLTSYETIPFSRKTAAWS